MSNIHSCLFTELTVDCSNKFNIFNIFYKSCLLFYFYIIIFILFFLNNAFTLSILLLFKKIFNL